VKTFLQNLSVLQEYTPQSRVTPKMEAAVEWLGKAIASFQDQNSLTLYGNCYVMSREKNKGIVWQHHSKQLAAMELGQRPTLEANQLFQKHVIHSYTPLIFKSYLEKPEKYAVPNRGKSVKEVSEVDSLKPKVTESETHEYPNERIIIVKGENLWFSYKVCLDKKGTNEEHEFGAAPENTTQFMVEFRADSDEDSDFCSSKQVKMALYTHFSNPIRQPLSIKKEPHLFSVRQMQLARHTPSQVIQLSYLCALLEQRDEESDSKRFTAITQFLKEAVKVVPVESVFNSIAYRKHDIALKCATALRERKLQLEPSELNILGALKSSIRARTGHDGVIIDRLYLRTVNSFQQVKRAAIMWLESVQLQGPPIPLPPIGVQTVTARLVLRPTGRESVQPATKTHAKGHMQKKARSAPPQKSQPSRTYSDVAKTPAGTDRLAKRSLTKAPQVMAVPFCFPIFLDPSIYPASIPFPEYLVKYLEDCLKRLIEHPQTGMCAQFGTGLNVVSKLNISELYPVLPRKSSHFKSPMQVLRDGLGKINAFTEGSTSPDRKLPNEQMLALIDGIFKCDVALCASLLGAFMEQQIRIPLIHTAKETAEALTSKTAPVAVGVWALFSQNLTTLQAKLESNNHTKLIIEIREYIKGIREQLPESEDDRMYAGKLQFLLQGVKQIVTASSQYISYSLERQLCSNLKFDKSYSLKHLISEWDTIFKNDALSLIGESHRPLVARWLKWTILVHDLREALAQYTCIGVTGFVNSGKSLLVKKLFKLEKVKVGVQAVKRTTVPLLYNLEESIEGLDVIDFPGVDDSDQTVPELARLLLSLAQIIIFVVDFKRAFSEPVKAWLQALTKNGAPVHVCLTHADELYSECKRENKLENLSEELKRIRTHFKLDAHRTREVMFYSFDHGSDVTTDELKQCGISSPADVGKWLVHILKSRFKQEELADKLEVFFAK
jgi:GTP-binding protein EngB required for normal cell division